MHPQMMADGDGWFVLQHARATLPLVPVVLLSAIEPQRPNDLPSNLGFDAVLQKPATPEALLATLWWLILKPGAGGASISTQAWQALATLASEGDVSGIEDWIEAQPTSAATHWERATLHRLDFDLL